MSDEKFEAVQVYVIAHKDGDVTRGPVKVGISSDPQRRVFQLQSGNPHELQLVYAFLVPSRELAASIERCFHETTDNRMVGEWFDMSAWEAARKLYSAFVISMWMDGLTQEQIDLAADYCGIAWVGKVLTPVHSESPHVTH